MKLDALDSGGPRAAVVFDLDGTLVDPAGGITGGIEYALGVMDLPVPGPEVLNAMIGPKLADGLVSILGVPADKVDAVIAAYRQWYTVQGMAMSVVYPGIKDLLAQLKSDGVSLAVATQKPEPLAKKLLAHHGLDEFFHVIRGSHADETLKPGDADYRSGKTEIIAAALRELAGIPEAGGTEGTGTEAAASEAAGTEAGTAVPTVSETVFLAELPSATARAGRVSAVMVGDRHQDVKGARSNGLNCIGVAWGFAAEGELAAAGVTAVVHSTAELALELAKPVSAPATATATAGMASGEGAHGAL